MENKTIGPNKSNRKFQSSIWRKKIKDSIELMEIYKDKKLSKDEVKSVVYLLEPIELGSWRDQPKNEVVKKVENPPAEIEHLKDSLKY